MGELRTPAKVKIIVGILAKDSQAVEAVRETLRNRFGEEELETVFIVSEVEVSFGDNDSVEVLPAEGEKCGRCWKYSKDVTPDGDSFLCPRCRSIVED